MIQNVDRAVLALASELVASGGRSFVVAGVAAAGLAAFRPKATSLRLFTWTAVLYASLVLPLLGWLVPPLHAPAPKFLQHGIALTAHHPLTDGPSRSPLRTRSVKTGGEGKRPANYPLQPVAKEPTSPGTYSAARGNASFAWAALPWSVIAAWIYVLIALFFLVRFVAGIVLSRKLVRNSRPISEGLAAGEFAGSAWGPAPRLATSECINVPVTVGAFWPTILLPSDWREWDKEKLDAVLAHEFSHVVRHDALTQCISLLYRAIFWFNPLAWWIHRHLAALAEQASDEAALSGGADQNHYARTLLSFFEALQTAPRRIRWQGVSIARPGQAEQRLERILAWKGTITMKVKGSLLVVILFLTLAVVYLAAAVRPVDSAPVASNFGVWQEPPAVPAAPPVGGISTVAPIHGIPATPAAPVAPVAPEPPIASLAPTAPTWNGFGQGHSSGTGSGKGFSYAYGFDDEERFVIVSGKSDSFTMSGSTQDARHVEKLKKQIPGDFIWFQHDEKSYIIRDQATIDRARGFWAGQEELGKKQEELGKQQEALGKQQEELGAKMEQVRVNVPDMTAALDKLKAKLQKLGPTATMEQIGDLQSEIGELQSKIGEIQSHAGEEQSKLGELQGELGEKQGRLGEQQGKLGEQQAEIAEKATRQMKELLDEAIKNGTAKAEDEIVKSPTL